MSDMEEKMREWQRRRKINGGPSMVTIYEPPPPPDDRKWHEKWIDAIVAWWKNIW